MDLSNVFQKEISLNCGQGGCSVNTFTGRLLYTFLDANINVGSYNLNVMHIYNSNLEIAPRNVELYGKKWKLNIEQYLYYENNDYCYIDSYGMKHTFKLLHDNKYYDTSGLNYILDATNRIITDSNGVTYKFNNNGQLTQINYKNYSKIIEFSNNRIYKYYDSRDNQRYIKFEYDSDGLLNQMRIETLFEKKFIMQYYYDTNSNLYEIKKWTSKGEKKLIRYNYIANSTWNELNEIILLDKKEQFIIEYTYNKKISKIERYNINLQTIKNEKDVQIDNGSFINEKEYIGDKEYDFIKGNIENSQLIESINFAFEYYNSHNCTATDNNHNSCTYFFDNDGKYMLSLEKTGEASYRKSNKLIGLNVLRNGTSAVNINNFNAILFDDKIISLSKYDNEHSMDRFNDFKAQVETSFEKESNFNLSFYLKLTGELISDKITVKITGNDNQTSFGYINKKAVDCWQEVNIPIKLVEKKFYDIMITFEMDETDPVGYYIADMKLSPSNYNKVFLFDTINNTKVNLNNLEKIKFIDYINNVEVEQLNLWKDVSMSLNDFIFLMKDYHVNSSDSYHTLSLNSGTLKYYAKDIKFIYNEDKEISLDSCKIIYETVNSIGDGFTEETYYFDEINYNQTIEKYFCIDTIGKKIVEEGNDIYNYAYKKYDMNNKILEEESGSGITKIYDYNQYDELIKCYFTDQNNEDEPYNEETYSFYPNLVIYENSINIITRKFDSGCVLIKEEIGSKTNENKYIVEYLYDVFNENLIGVITNSDDNVLDNEKLNYIKYSEKGEIIECGSNNILNDKGKNNNIYKFEYRQNYDFINGYQDVVDCYVNYYEANGNLIRDKLKNTKTYYDKNEENDEKQLMIIEENDEINNYKIEFDEKNRVKLITCDNNNRVKYEYNIDAINNNNINSTIDYITIVDSYNDIAEKYQFTNDNISKKIMYFPYVYLNSNDTEINHFTNKERILTKEITNDKITYKEFSFGYNDDEYRFTNDIHFENSNYLATPDTNFIVYNKKYDNNILVPRILNTNLKVLSEDASIKTTYLYDGYGNIIQKNILNEMVTDEDLFKSFYRYEYGSNRLKEIQYLPDNANRNIHSILEYDYKNNIISNRVDFVKNNINTGYTNTYVYDDNNQLIEEVSNFGTKQYSYHKDGSIKQINHTLPNESNVRYDYIYDKGLLTQINKNNSANIIISYDEYRRCSSITKGNVIQTLEWSEGKLIGISTTGKDIYFDYNLVNGQRYQKTVMTNEDGVVNGSSVQYYYDDGMLLKEERNGISLIYLYDEQGLYGFSLVKNNNIIKSFYYIKNYDNSILGIVDDQFNLIGRYTYDAYGNFTIDSESGNVTEEYNYDYIMNLNPIRYKGYYYDEETNLALVSSRYYSPELGRFIQPADVSSLDPQSINGLNLYTYANNNPIGASYSNFDSTMSEYSVDNNLIAFENSQTPINSSIFNQTIKESFKSGLWFRNNSFTELYADWNARAQISLRKGTFKLGVAGKFSLANISDQIGFGTDDLNFSIKGVGDLGTVSGMAGIFIDPKKKNYFVGVEIEAAVLSGRIGGQLEIFGLQIEGGVSGKVLAIGGRFGVGVKDGTFYYYSGFSVLFGWDVYIRIRFDKLFR